MQKFAFFHVKGGVGKTTSAVNLAYEIARSGRKTVLWDLDPQASASWYLGVDDDNTHENAIKILKEKVPVGKLRLRTPYKRLNVIPADESLNTQALFFAKTDVSRKLLTKLVDALGETQSVVIFDCAPALSGPIDNVFSAVDALLVPMIPSPLSLRAFTQLKEYLNHKKWKRLKVLPFFTMVDRRRKLHNDIIENKSRLMPGALNTYIPYASIVEQMGVKRAPLGSFAASSPAAIAYRELWHELSEKF